MSILKSPKPLALMAILAAAGASCALAGVYLMLGLAWMLVVGGVAAAALGLLADV